MLPDYMPDLYDTIKLDDLDNEDIDFQIFLQGLINGEGMLSIDEEREQVRERTKEMERKKREKEGREEVWERTNENERKNGSSK
jgi:hypothetical protein